MTLTDGLLIGILLALVGVLYDLRTIGHLIDTARRRADEQASDLAETLKQIDSSLGSIYSAVRPRDPLLSALDPSRDAALAALKVPRRDST